MSKEKIGRSELKQRFSFYTHISIDSVYLESLFRYHDPDYYNSGVYGWNFDVWTFPKQKVLIASGDRVPMYYKTVSEEILKRYMGMANEVKLEDYDYSFVKCRDKLEDLIDEFINEVSSL